MSALIGRSTCVGSTVIFTLVGGGAGPGPNRARTDDARRVSALAAVRPGTVNRTAPLANATSPTMPTTPSQRREIPMSLVYFEANRIGVPVVMRAATR